MSLTRPATEQLAQAFANPPDTSKPWVYWWWLEGAASREGITRDLEEMKRQGIAGVLVFTSGLGGNAPAGPSFMSEEWRENFRFAVEEADRLGIDVSVNLCDGWDAGGPWVEREDAVKDLVWSETTVDGPDEGEVELVQPAPGVLWSATLGEDELVVRRPNLTWYRDVVTLACPEGPDGTWRLEDAVDVTDRVQDGWLRWPVSEGRWTILRFGCDLGGQRTSASAVTGWEVDPMSARAMDNHFTHTAAKLIADAGLLAGKTLKYVHVDSWEIGDPTWTQRFPEEFRRRRGYDPLPYLPALAGKTPDSPEISERFLWDYRRTIADVVTENYYGRLAQLAHEHGVGMHSEAGGAGGFQGRNIDGLECLGACDIPMGEFWTNFKMLIGPSEEERVVAPMFRTGETFPENNFGSVIQAAIASHVYGRPLAQAEAFTSFLCDWVEDPASLKPRADRAFCLGLTRNVLCFYVHQISPTAKPGYQWEHVGTHFDRNLTWWDKSHAFFTYLARCQHLLTQGMFAADVLYVAGEAVPNYVLTDRKPIPGYNFDVTNAQALLTRVGAKDGQVILPDGLTYRYLVLPEGGPARMSPAVIEKIKDLVEEGVTLVGDRPRGAPGLTDYPRADDRVRALADELFGPEDAPSGVRHVGQGWVIRGTPLEEVMPADGLLPDLELRSLPEDSSVDWIHRHLPDGDIYFLANLSEQELTFEAVFRVAGMAPELWDPVNGSIRELPRYSEESGRTLVSMRLEPRQSLFVVFNEVPNGPGERADGDNFPLLHDVAQIGGPWEVSFDPDWGGPERATFEALEDWTRRSEDGIRYYSGTATYRKTFDLPPGAPSPLYLDLGEVKNLASVQLNGRDLGVVWTAPWRVEISGAVREGLNELEIEVVNLWPNRLIGDGRLPPEERRTVTNVRTYEATMPRVPLVPESPGGWSPIPEHLMPSIADRCPVCKERAEGGKERDLFRSGLLGPVVLKR